MSKDEKVVCVGLCQDRTVTPRRRVNAAIKLADICYAAPGPDTGRQIRIAVNCLVEVFRDENLSPRMRYNAAKACLHYARRPDSLQLAKPSRQAMVSA